MNTRSANTPEIHTESKKHRSDIPALIGQSRDMIRIRQEIQTLSDRNTDVLITGETGTGKEIIVRAIHFHSP